MSEPEMNNPQVGNNERPDGAEPMDSPGARLAAYRHDRGWTVEQVASQLNLAPRQIVALESDDYPALPGKVIVRGFIRAYAKLLKVDATPMLAAIGGETIVADDSLTPRKTLATPFSETRLPTMMDRPDSSSKWIVGLLLALLIGVGIWAARQNGEFASLTGTASSQVKTGLELLRDSGSHGTWLASKPGAVATVAKTGEPETSAKPDNVEAPATKDMPSGQSDATLAPPAATTQNPPAAPVPAETSAGHADATPLPAIAPPGGTASTAVPVVTPVPPSASSGSDNNALVFKVHEDSWIEIKRVRDGGIVVSRVMSAGETQSFDMSEPVSVVLGNAAGVDASLRGTPLQIKGSSSNDVARLTLK